MIRERLPALATATRVESPLSRHEGRRAAAAFWSHSSLDPALAPTTVVAVAASVARKIGGSSRSVRHALRRDGYSVPVAAPDGMRGPPRRPLLVATTPPRKRVPRFHPGSPRSRAEPRDEWILAAGSSEPVDPRARILGSRRPDPRILAVARNGHASGTMSMRGVQRTHGGPLRVGDELACPREGSPLPRRIQLTRLGNFLG